MIFRSRVDAESYFRRAPEFVLTRFNFSAFADLIWPDVVVESALISCPCWDTVIRVDNKISLSVVGRFPPASKVTTRTPWTV